MDLRSLNIFIQTAELNSFTKAATNDDIEFNFRVDPYQKVTYCGMRNRETSKPKNCWKVRLNHSGEGSGTITRFWLASGTDVVSDSMNVKQGSGNRYKFAFSSANRSVVRLRACNNNYSANSYNVAGFWDEETGVYKEN